MAEGSERVENILFRVTRENTEACIEQATAAMRCHGANSPEPRRRVVLGLDTSALRAADQQPYNHTSLTSQAHRGSLSKRRRLCSPARFWGEDWCVGNSSIVSRFFQENRTSSACSRCLLL